MNHVIRYCLFRLVSVAKIENKFVTAKLFLIYFQIDALFLIKLSNNDGNK